MRIHRGQTAKNLNFIARHMLQWNFVDFDDEGEAEECSVAFSTQLQISGHPLHDVQFKLDNMSFFIGI